MDELHSPQAKALTASDQDPRSRERLLRAAVAVFDRKGYAAASVREIVEQAGITKPALYYHFGSKEGILVAILQEGVRQFHEAMGRALGRPGTGRERVAAVCEELYALYKQHLPVARVAHGVYFGPQELIPDFDLCQFERTLDDALGQVIEAGISSGEFQAAPLEDIATAIKGVIQVCINRELDPRATPVGSDGLHRVLDLIFDGLSATRNEKEN